MALAGVSGGESERESARAAGGSRAGELLRGKLGACCTAKSNQKPPQSPCRMPAVAVRFTVRQRLSKARCGTASVLPAPFPAGNASVSWLRLPGGVRRELGQEDPNIIMFSARASSSDAEATRGG
eukprot:2648108-Rhodomonas_salina.1